MVYFNRSGETFVPPGYPGVDFATAQSVEPTPDVNNGLYYRSRVFPELGEQVTECLNGQLAFSDLSVDADQSWNESGWKKPHGSAEASERFVLKLREEIHEADDALEEYWQTRDQSHFVEELGDLKWVMTALASNGGAVINDNLKERLYDYVAGTRVVTEEGKFDYPEWYDVAAQLSIKRGSLTIGDLDQLTVAGFVPQFTPVINLYEEETVPAVAFLTWDFPVYSNVLKNWSDELHGAAERYPALDSREITAKIGKVAADGWLKIAAMAHLVDSNLETVVRTNIEKISGRITANLIDKNDGDRSQNT